MTRAIALSRLPIVFGLAEDEAAAAVGLGATKFKQMVADRRMPAPRRIDGRKVWDVDELRAAFKSLPHDGEDGGEVDTWADAG